MKKIGFLTFGFWRAAAGSQTRSAADALLQTVGRAHDDQIGLLDGARARFGRTYAGEPDRIAAELGADDAVRAADTVPFTVPNQLGVDYNARMLGTIATHIAPAIGWTPAKAAAAAPPSWRWRRRGRRRRRRS